MDNSFETLGNATILVFEDGRPILATDPWLKGTCYFGSWGLERPLSERQIADVAAAPYIWISHGHPDHLHPESLKLLPRGKTILLPDHYHGEIRDFLSAEGFQVEVMPYRQWRRLSDSVSVLCLDNENQDAILLVRVGDALIVNLNDSPLCGEAGFIAGLVKRHPNDKTYMTALCAAGTADMLNYVDAEGRSCVGAPEARKPAAVWQVARMAARLGVRHYCFSSAQHRYVRPETEWINAYAVGWADVERHWSRSGISLVPPFVRVDLATGAVTSTPAEPEAPQAAAAPEDREARLSPEEWLEVERFVRRFELLRGRVDYVAFCVGGETRRFEIGGASRAERAKRGVTFTAPKEPLLETVKYGYFDDLLIGNLMKTRLQNMELYPHFTPIVAKLGGNAKVFDREALRRFELRYLKRNPLGFVLWRIEQFATHLLVPTIRGAAERGGIKGPLRRLYRALLGDPIQTPRP